MGLPVSALAFSGLALALALAPSLSPAPRRSTLQADDAGAPAPASLPACVSVKTESRYVPYGYNHIVYVTNGCAKPASCSVATDVNPTPQTVEIASGKGAEVLTFSGSPASSFTARVSCKLR